MLTKWFNFLYTMYCTYCTCWRWMMTLYGNARVSRHIWTDESNDGVHFDARCDEQRGLDRVGGWKMIKWTNWFQSWFLNWSEWSNVDRFLNNQVSSLQFSASFSYKTVKFIMQNGVMSECKVQGYMVHIVVKTMAFRLAGRQPGGA